MPGSPAPLHTIGPVKEFFRFFDLIFSHKRETSNAGSENINTAQARRALADLASGHVDLALAALKS
jgi:hypothetical protein